MNSFLAQLIDVFDLMPGQTLAVAPVSQFDQRLFLAANQVEKPEAIDLVLWTSVENAQDFVRVQRTPAGWVVSLHSDRAAEGLLAREDTPQESRRNVRLVRQLSEADFTSHGTASPPGTSLIQASAQVSRPDEAIRLAERMALILTERLGMEMALANLEAVRPNVQEITDHNLGLFFPMDGQAPKFGKAVIFSELTQCIRCRNNWPEAIHLTRQFAGIAFGFVFLNKSRANFKRRVFMEQRPDIGASGIVAPTAFVMDQGMIVDYVGTRLDERPPAAHLVEQAVAQLAGAGT